MKPLRDNASIFGLHQQLMGRVTSREQTGQATHLGQGAVRRAGEDLHPGVPRLRRQGREPRTRRRRLGSPRRGPRFASAHPLPFHRFQLLSTKHAPLRNQNKRLTTETSPITKHSSETKWALTGERKREEATRKEAARRRGERRAEDAVPTAAAVAAMELEAGGAFG
jgi:hypothetical protein